MSSKLIKLDSFDLLTKKYGKTCFYCNQIPTSKNSLRKGYCNTGLTKDHIIPACDLGIDNITNYIYCCYYCNLKRGNINFIDFCKINKVENYISLYKRAFTSNIIYLTAQLFKKDLYLNTKRNKIIKNIDSFLIKAISIYELMDYDLSYLEEKYLDLLPSFGKEKVFEEVFCIIRNDSIK
jgi:hypothetical protein